MRQAVSVERNTHTHARTRLIDWVPLMWKMMREREVVVTLLAPGRRWSLTYGSASPLESMAFSPCGETHTGMVTDAHAHAHICRYTQ